MKKVLYLLGLLLLVLCSCEEPPAPDPLSYGADVVGCTIVYEPVNGGRIENCATSLLFSLPSGTDGSVVPSNEEHPSSVSNGKALVLIGNTGEPESLDAANSFITPMDYVIRIKDGKTVIIGGTPFATAAATEKFIQLLYENKRLLSCTEYEYIYHFDTNWLSPLCYGVEDFNPKWMEYYDIPGWMNDLYETMYAVSHHGGRMAAVAHRGDFTYYPNGSVEGIISACMAGADLIELDFRLTKDNIPVLMHEEDMSYCTDVMQKKGKNGLPDSVYIGDWTFQQLRELNLINNNDGNTYKVATCYEALVVARMFGSMLTWDDKADETEFPVFAATEKTTMEDMLPLMLDTDTFHYFFYYYCKYQSYTKKLEAFDVPGMSDTCKRYYEFWKKCVADTLNTKKPGSSKKYTSLPSVSSLWDSMGWSLQIQQETEQNWQDWYDAGDTMFWTNSIVACCDYIGRNFTAEDYYTLLLGE